MPCEPKDTAGALAERFFPNWVVLFGLPKRLVLNCNKLFTGRFWRSLHTLLGVQLQMSTLFHPETDSRSKRTNSAVIQILCQYVLREQRNWVNALALAAYAINTATNDSTSQVPFEVVLGHPPVAHLPPPAACNAAILLDASEWVEARKTRVQAVRNDLAAAKVRPAVQANKKQAPNPPYAVSDAVMVDTAGRCAKYKSAGRDVRAAKMFELWDGPSDIIEVFPGTLTVRVALPTATGRTQSSTSPRSSRTARRTPSLRLTTSPASGLVRCQQRCRAPR